MRANGDGSGAGVIATFPPGAHPVGLDWSADVNSLIFSLADQINNGGVFRTSASARICSIDSSNGSGFQQVSGLAGAFLPSVGSGTVTGGGGSLDDARLTLTRTGSGTFQLAATGLDPGATYQLSSSTTLGAGSFGAAQPFSGAQLLAGIPVTSGDPSRYFRLSN